MEIALLLAWIVILIVDIYTTHKTEKSNKEVLENIDALTDLVNKSIKQNDYFTDQTDKLINATDKKSTAQANFLWKSVIILANRISDLEDQQNV